MFSVTIDCKKILYIHEFYIFDYFIFIVFISFVRNLFQFRVLWWKTGKLKNIYEKRENKKRKVDGVTTPFFILLQLLLFDSCCSI